MGLELAFIGLIVSLAFIALTGITPGGIIVPSYLALFGDQPLRIAGTLIAAVLAFAAYRAASRFLILFGRRRLVFLILLGGLWTWVGARFIPNWIPASMEFRVIGWVVPGLIANQFEKQGVWITSAALITVTVLIHFIGRALQTFT